MTEHLLDVLRRKGSAVHFSEFHLLKLEAWPSVTPHLAFTLATLDPATPREFRTISLSPGMGRSAS